MSERRLILNANVTGSGRHPGAWRLQPDPSLFVDPDFYINIARVAERGALHAVFFADFPAIPGEPPSEPYQAFDNSVLLAALAVATERIGLVGTASTTYNAPFDLARRYATLDHLSHGRAALNLVTTGSPRAAQNFGLDEHPEHADRYARADEFADVLAKLWDSWEDDAIIGDKAVDRWIAPDRLHTVDHVGEHFRVRGPLVVPRSPQGRPLLFQAGGSEGGRNLGARVADAIFTAQTTLTDAQVYYADLKSRAARFGRDPEHLKILPGFFPVVGSTEAEAKALKAELNGLLDLERERIKIAFTVGLDPADVRLDAQLPYERIDFSAGFAGAHGSRDSTVQLARAQRLTVRELIQHSAGFHRQVVGAPEQVADHIEHWFTNRAADGFNLNFAVFPQSLELFVDHVVPELRRRGLFRHEYSGRTFRENLGLPRPASQFAEAAHALTTF